MVTSDDEFSEPKLKELPEIAIVILTKDFRPIKGKKSWYRKVQH